MKLQEYLYDVEGVAKRPTDEGMLTEERRWEKLIREEGCGTSGRDLKSVLKGLVSIHTMTRHGTTQRTKDKEAARGRVTQPVVTEG